MFHIMFLCSTAAIVNYDCKLIRVNPEIHKKWITCNRNYFRRNGPG